MEGHADARARLARVTDLIEGFESPFGLELLSTVHWLLNHEGVRRVDKVVAATHAWNSRKQQFTPRQIDIALHVLVEKRFADPLDANSI